MKQNKAGQKLRTAPLAADLFDNSLGVTTKNLSCIKRSTVGQVIWKLRKSKLSVNCCSVTADNEGQPLSRPRTRLIISDIRKHFTFTPFTLERKR
jgi:hypothetical protein